MGTFILPRNQQMVSSIPIGRISTLENQVSFLYSIIGSGIASSVLPTPSTINDSNLAFTFTQKPSVLVINGGVYSQTGGSITWTWTAGTLTATLSSVVGTGGSIFGLK